MMPRSNPWPKKSMKNSKILKITVELKMGTRQYWLKKEALEAAFLGTDIGLMILVLNKPVAEEFLLYLDHEFDICESQIPQSYVLELL